MTSALVDGVTPLVIGVALLNKNPGFGPVWILLFYAKNRMYHSWKVFFLARILGQSCQEIQAKKATWHAGGITLGQIPDNGKHSDSPFLTISLLCCVLPFQIQLQLVLCDLATKISAASEDKGFSVNRKVTPLFFTAVDVLTYSQAREKLGFFFQAQSWPSSCSLGKSAFAAVTCNLDFCCHRHTDFQNDSQVDTAVRVRFSLNSYELWGRAVMCW